MGYTPVPTQTDYVDNWTNQEMNLYVKGNFDVGVPAIAQAKGDLFPAVANQQAARLAVGADGRLLVANSAQASGINWALDQKRDVIAVKGDLFAGSAADTIVRVPNPGAGWENWGIKADSSQAAGLRFSPFDAADLVQNKGDIIAGSAADTLARFAMPNGGNSAGAHLICNSADPQGLRWGRVGALSAKGAINQVLTGIHDVNVAAIDLEANGATVQTTPFEWVCPATAAGTYWVLAAVKCESLTGLSASENIYLNFMKNGAAIQPQNQPGIQQPAGQSYLFSTQINLITFAANDTLRLRTVVTFTQGTLTWSYIALIRVR